MTSAISLSNISKSFKGTNALSNINISIEQGEFFALLGPNGAGKTTLISILGGLLTADSGTAKILGYDVITQYRQARRNIGIVPQELVFDPFFTVRETLEFQSGYFGIKNNRRWIDEILAHLHLENKANTNMRHLSGGMKRRVMVAQALVHKPPVIVLDEPTAGVDVELRKTLWEFIQRLNTEGHTIILTTHYLEEAEQLCNRIGVLRAGQMITLADKKALIETYPSHSVFLFTLPSGQILPGSLAHLLDGPQQENFSLRFKDSHELEAILHLLHQNGSHPKNIEIQQSDLEDIFIELMQRHTTRP